MAVDYRINLAKGMTSAPEQRARFYNGMLIYLLICFAGLAAVGFFGSVNIRQTIKNHQQQAMLQQTVCSVSGVTEDAFLNPDETFRQLEDRAYDIAQLKRALGQRVHLLPVIHNLFTDLPSGVSLQSLSANKEQLAFGLVMPLSSDDAGDPVALLSAAWEKNEELMNRVVSIRPLNGERRNTESGPVFFVQFECILKK
ncbi:hypothetical protein P4B35_10670 [Pontiellaceae bacterium B12227]|nr:hypothetical protein [Pontiellaceae bacterium B12227]